MNEIIQCPEGCGRLVRQSPAGSVNAAGAWAGMPHSCAFDGANVRGDNDDGDTRAEELAALDDEEGACA
jgi:hypothetical protein